MAVEWSVVIPAYNEAAVIGATVQQVVAYLTAHGWAHEILVVDDGSTDRTRDVVEVLARRLPSVRVVAGSHRGKGAAVRCGMQAATGAFRLFMDADYSTRIEELDQCLPLLRAGCPVVIGSRKMPGAVITKHQPRGRELMGKGFTWLTNVWLGVRVTDITCGFKCFQAAAAERLFALQRLDAWGFDAELLFLARRCGYRISEVPVTWTNDEATKVRLGVDTLRSFGELLQIRGYAWSGAYAWPPRGERA